MRSHNPNDQLSNRKAKNLQNIKAETDKFCVFSHPSIEKGKLQVGTMEEAFKVQMNLALEYETHCTIAEGMGSHSAPIRYRDYQLNYLTKNKEIKLFNSKLEAQINTSYYQSKKWTKDQINKVKNLFKKREIFEYDLDLGKATNTHAIFEFKGK